MAKIKGAPAPHKGHAAGSTDIEKAASQLVSDVKYKVRKEMSGATHMNPAQVAAKYLQKLNQSAKAGTAPAVIALARKKLSAKTVKEEIMNSIDAKDMATDAVANALYKVFIEKKEDTLEEKIEELKEAYAKVNKKGERIYHVIVKDKKTGNTYTRDATREKIAELRANPNIASVEMSERRLDSEKERTKGAKTAAVKAGKGLDPVGQEDGDVDNDGDKDKSDKYLMKRRNAVGAAIAKRKGVAEAFLGEVNDEALNPDANEQEIDVMKGKNTVKINPEAPGMSKKGLTSLQLSHYEAEKSFISEKALSQAQQKFMGMVLATKRGASPMSPEVAKAAKGMTEKQARDFAKTKHKGLPKKKTQTPVKEETVAQADKKAKKEQDEMDPRSIPTAMNLAKNKLRAMGLKCSFEPDAQVVEQEDKERRGTDYKGRDYGTGKQNKTIPPEGVMQGGWLEREKLKKA